MIETITLITICMIYLIFFRPGKTPPLENPLVIERAGKYHITLAPKLNLAQPFIEEIARQVNAVGIATGSSTTLCFTVRDKQVTAHGYDLYLLAATQRNGMLYFQTASPSSNDPAGQVSVIREFADKVLARFPDEGEHDTAADEALVAAAQQAAQLRGVEIKRLE